MKYVLDASAAIAAMNGVAGARGRLAAVPGSEVGIPMVYVSHYARELRRIANVVVRLEAGRIAAIGGPGILSKADEVAFA